MQEHERHINALNSGSYASNARFSTQLMRPIRRGNMYLVRVSQVFGGIAAARPRRGTSFVINSVTFTKSTEQLFGRTFLGEVPDLFRATSKLLGLWKSLGYTCPSIWLPARTHTTVKV